jgi:hypothetical protein
MSESLFRAHLKPFASETVTTFGKVSEIPIEKISISLFYYVKNQVDHVWRVFVLSFLK